ncbi:MAG: hypothetical protein AAFO04_22855 [Cyanobacteria bacterium J06592_8]
MTVQDDRRENELIDLFELRRPQNQTRSGIDAILDWNNQQIPFELKSSTKASVTTVRDFGPEHIRKWQNKHWLFGFYSSDGLQLKYCLYASPEMMKSWILEKERYVEFDYLLAQIVPELLNLSKLYQILGQKESYSLEDAKRLQKKQYNHQEYREKMDFPNGYSPERMLEILKDRCQYLIKRGSTLNNPHIPASYFKDWEKITTNHAHRLRVLVSEELQDKA